MSIDTTELERLYDSRFTYKGEIAHTRSEPAKNAERVPAEEVLPPEIANALPFDPYIHQAEGLRHLAAGDNVTVATATASGKTLVYALDFARRKLENPDATGLFVYPMRALTRNQFDNIDEFLNDTLGLDIELGVYDGDTPSERKKEIRKNADIILTNFAGVNHYLSHHEKWARIYRNLELVVADESHQYGGLHGMHVAWILRRLKRVVREYNGGPQYVLATATIGNPIEHANALTGEDAALVDNDGSEQGARDIVFWNPPFEPVGPDPDEEDTGSSTSFTANKLTAILANKGIQTLLFTDSRTMSEVGEKRVSSLVSPSVKIQSYHAGHGQETRRETENGLRDGSLNAVISTSALELGIDVGGLDGTVLSGYPGTRQSFWQRIGRAGRGSKRALSILVADYKGLDQYIARNPDYIFEESVENAVIDLSNNKVYAQHVLCAANESPLTWDDAPDFGGENRLERVVEMWKTAGLLTGSLDTGVSYTRSGRPEADVDLYTTGSDESFEVRVENGSIDHEPVERTRAYRDFHEGAVVLHNGQEYVVEELNEDTRKPYVLLSEQYNITYYTRTQRSVEVSNLNSQESLQVGDFTIHRGTAEVVTHFHTYEERKITNNARLGTYPTNNPPLTMQTHVMWIEPDDVVSREMLTEFGTQETAIALRSDDDERTFALSPSEDEDTPPRAADPAETNIVLGGLHAAEHAMIGAAPLTMMLDKRDLGGLSSLNHPETETTAALFVYDGVPGGVGFSHGIFDRLSMLAETTEDLIDGCQCGEVTGCPACSMDENCGDNNEPLHNPAAVWFLQQLQDALDSTSVTPDSETAGAEA
jgi:DEAD/DEAH box helicase domain-containing protein